MNLFTFLISLLVLTSCASHKKHGHHHRFDDATKWSKVFENDKRKMWQQPQKVIQAAGVKESSIVADIGAATGFFPVRIAQVAKKGRVWGIDIEPNLVRYLNGRARREKIKNLFSILGTAHDAMIPEKVDFIFIVNTYHHISHRVHYFRKLKNSLAKSGKVVIVDFRKGDLPFGPKDHAKISKSDMIEEMEEAGFAVHKSHDFLPYQNFVVFK